MNQPMTWAAGRRPRTAALALVLLLVSALLVYAGWSRSGSAQPFARLRVSFVVPPAPLRTVELTLTCHPDGGTFPDPRSTCAAVARHRQFALENSSRAVCGGSPATPTVSVRGRYDGRPVDTYFDTCVTQHAGWWFAQARRALPLQR
jgi:hypothetical protein